MSEIKYSKEEYDTKMGYLTYMQSYIGDGGQSKDMEEPANSVSDTITEFVDIYSDLQSIVTQYLSALGTTVTSLQNAGDAIYEADQSTGEGMEK